MAGSKRPKIWIDKADLDPSKYNHKKADYIMWVDSMQRNWYRIMKTYKDNPKIKKIALLALEKNYYYLYNAYPKHHLQNFWYIAEKFHAMVKDGNDDTLISMAVMMFGMIQKLASFYGIKIKKGVVK